MPVVGRLKDGNLLITGDVNERLPVVQNGLVAHFPFDGTTQSASLWGTGWTDSRTGNGAIQDVGKTSYKVKPGMKLRFTGEFRKSGLNANDFWFFAYQYNTTTSAWIWHAGTFDRNFPDNEWTYREVEITIGGTAGDVLNQQSQGISLRQTITAGTLEWRDCQCYIIEDGSNYYDTNTTLTDEYIAIEDATTNILDPVVKAWNPWSGLTGSTVEYKNAEGRNGVYLKADNSGGVQWHNTGGQKVASPSTVYTVSAKIKYKGGTPNANLLYLRQYRADGSQISEAGQYSSAREIDLGNDWKFTYTTFTTHAECVKLLIQGYEYNPREIWIEDVQCEQKAWATSYVNGSRAGGGQINIPFEYKPPYTINLWHRGMKPLAQVVDQSTSPMIIQMGNYYGNASVSLWNYVKDFRTYIKGNSAAGWTSSKGYTTFSSATWDLKEHMYTITLDADKRTFKVYMDGIYMGTETSSEDVTNIGFINLGNAYQPNARYRDLSIYNRVLTDSEIKKLYGQPFQVTQSGNLIVGKIVEKPNGIPSNTLYLPLDFDNKDRSKIIAPATEISTVYENGAVWVGNNATNILLNPEVNHATWEKSYNSSITYSYDGPVDGRVVATFKPNSTGSYWYCYSDQAPWADATTYTVSLWVKAIEAPVSISFYTADNSEAGRYWSEYRTVNPADGWTRVVWNPYTTPNPCNQDSLSFNWSGTAGAKMAISAPQAEATPFPTPNVIGTRDSTRLEYPPSLLNVNAGAIIGWWKFDEKARAWRGPGNNNDYAMLFSTYEGAELNKLNIRSYYSGPANQWSTSVRGPLATDPTHVINFTVSDGWHMVCLAWDKVNGKLKLLIDGILVQEITGATLPAAYINPLRIGQWDTGVWGAMNQYVKDLVILNYYPTDAEIKSMSKTQMRAHKDRLQIQGNLKDNQTL